MVSNSSSTRIQQASDSQTENSVLVASIALLVYDMLLTFSAEFHFIWRTKFRLATALYVVARYGRLLYLLMAIISDSSVRYGFFVILGSSFNPLARTCTALIRAINILETLPGLGAEGLFLARAYAVSRHNRVVLSLLLVLYAIIFTIDLVSFPFDNCTNFNRIVNTRESLAANHLVTKPTETLTVTTVEAGCVALFDFLVFWITAYHVFSLTGLRLAFSAGPDKTLTEFLIKQGVLRFLVIFLWSLDLVIMNLTLRESVSNISAALENTVSVIIACRFLLELRAQADSSRNFSKSASTTMSFRAVIGYINSQILQDFRDPESWRGPKRDETLALENLESSSEGASSNSNSPISPGTT
ncbi:hypothetical protein M422DRAFT_241473 [Sphaerobolus stellatus SS14]|nr:hypothetical protein M422DRAFT_241473 [Sphaerobolus stellatus SS14]